MSPNSSPSGRVTLQMHVQMFVHKTKLVFNPSSPQGKNRLILLAMWSCFFIFLLYKHNPLHISTLTSQSSGIFAPASVNSKEKLGILPPTRKLTFMDDEQISHPAQNNVISAFIDDSEDEDDLESSKSSNRNKAITGSSIDEGDYADSSDDKEENDSISAELKGEQQSRLKDHGAQLLEFFNKYRSNTEISAHFKELQHVYSPLGMISAKSFGQSYGGHPLVAYKVGKGSSGKNVVVLGLEHAAEWPSAMSLVYFTTRMLQLYGINDEATKMLDEVFVHVIPIMNPDGFVYSQSSTSSKHRYYQMNRAKAKKTEKFHLTSAIGFDIGVDYGAFSQLETSGLRKFIESLGHLDGVVSVQCCGGAVILPEAPSCVVTEAKDDVLNAAQKVLGALSGTKKSYKLMEHKATASSSLDAKKKKSKRLSTVEDKFAVSWAVEDLNVKYAFQIEARPSSIVPEQKKKRLFRSSSTSPANALDLPEAELIPVSREITKAIMTLSLAIADDVNSKVTGCEDAQRSRMVTNKNTPFNTATDDDESDFEDDSGLVPTEDYDDDDSDVEVGSEDEIIDSSDGVNEIGAIPEIPNAEEEDGASNDLFEDSEDVTNDMEEITEEGEKEDEFDNSEVEDNEDKDDFEAEIAYGNEDEEGLPSIDVAVDPNFDSDAPIQSKSGPTITAKGTFYYFAFNHDMLDGILKTAGLQSARKLGVARLEDYSFDYTYHSRKTWGSGIADCFRHKSGKVYGVIYEIDAAELRLLKRHNLDFTNPQPEDIPGIRFKKSRMAMSEIEVITSTGKTIKAITFRVREKMPGQDVIKRFRRFSPSRQYKNCMLNGAIENNLPQEYTDRIKKIPSMLTDRPGLRKFRNPAIGTLCDA